MKQFIKNGLHGTTVALSLVITLTLTTVQAQTAEERGLAIAAESNFRANGFGDTKSNMTMVLLNKSGKESVRKMRSLTLEVPGDGDKRIIIFDEPKDVKGTVSLTYSHALEADEQWLYLPALKRVKRISSKNKTGPFMGSEFAFEDIGSQELEKYSYRFVDVVEFNGRETYMVEYIPQYRNTGYTRLISWIDAEHYYSVKTEYYDRKNALLKTMMLSDHNLHQDKFWRAHELRMDNHRNGKSTTLSLQAIEFENGLTESDFNSASLKRTR